MACSKSRTESGLASSLSNITINVALADRAYPIIIGQDLFCTSQLAAYICAKQVCIVTNSTIAAHYLAPLKQALQAYQVTDIVLPDGEQYKNLSTFSTIIDQLVQQQQRRNTTLIALGGGVIGDLTGFAAACYQRGVAFIQVPTSLLAQIDASVGGKTAVNHAQGKNLIGAFYQPKCVLINTDVLSTLPKREFQAGLAEVIKYGLIADADFFAWLEQHMLQLLQADPALLTEMIARCCRIKAAIVQEDETEQGKRAILNFGHSFAHALESLTQYESYLHGEAVAIGMVYAIRLAEQLGALDQAVLTRLLQLYQQIGLTSKLPEHINVADFIAAMHHDKKNTDNNTLVLILLKQLGQAYIHTAITNDQVRAILSS